MSAVSCAVGSADGASGTPRRIIKTIERKSVLENEKIKVGFVSLGCSKNLMDTEVMLHSAMEAGYELVADESEADVVIINTCAFIESAKAEAIDNILDVAWLKENKNLRAIIVTGCLAERYRSDILRDMPEVDAVLGVGSIGNIAEAIDAVLRGERYSSFEDKEKAPLGGSRIVTTGDAMAYLKIAEGCSNRCTYCAIPNIRGKMRSRTIEDITEEAAELSDMGVKELCVIAQDTTSYGLDLYGRLALPELLRELLEKTDFCWIRLLYLYPDRITDDLLDVIASSGGRILPYFDVPIQHISDSVLKRMNRRGDGAVIRSAIAHIRDKLPEAVIRTTVIVGFPGETEEDFAELCEFVKETKFDRFGAFTYSREEDTPAYSMPDQIDAQTAQDRYDIIMKEQLEIAAEKNAQRIGEVIEVLTEDFDPVAECFFGRSAGEAPDVDGKIYFRAKEKPAQGDMVTVKITEAMDYDLIGEMQGKVLL